MTLKAGKPPMETTERVPQALKGAEGEWRGILENKSLTPFQCLRHPLSQWKSTCSNPCGSCSYAWWMGH